MPRLPNLRRIYTHDFPEEAQDLIQKLSESLNINLEVLYDALNNKLTLRDNMACTLRSVDIEVDANGHPLSKTSVELTNNMGVYGVQVTAAQPLKELGIYPYAQPFVTYSMGQDGRLSIIHVSGIQPNIKYRLNLIIWN